MDTKIYNTLLGEVGMDEIMIAVVVGSTKVFSKKTFRKI